MVRSAIPAAVLRDEALVALATYAHFADFEHTFERECQRADLCRRLRRAVAIVFAGISAIALVHVAVPATMTDPQKVQSVGATP